MAYFIIFDKKGIVEHEEGDTPIFLNSLIRTINIRQSAGSKNIRDMIMEYKIEGHRVYLSLGTQPRLAEAINNYKAKGSQDTDIEKNVQKTIIPPADVLDFSDLNESSSKLTNIIETMKKGELRRTFSLFSGKISADQLQIKMIGHLVKKNVDPTLSKILTDDIMSEIKSENIDLISESLFKKKIEKSLNKIIPRFDHDAFIKKIRDHPGVFSICFVGVNGVGKSTTLAKIACWLIQNGLRVYIAACDTFRAGAIEQLKVHVERFKLGGHDVGFFESGYAKDDASVAKHAISKANDGEYDVILIDTAGRMHNKEALMISLSKLVKINSPDFIIFVGEALVGGDSLDHIKEFNRRISDGSAGRKIDGIILTKIDTVDDKIGQVLNFTFTGNSPIMFLGTGQSNKDLVAMEAESVSDILLS